MNFSTVAVRCLAVLLLLASLTVWAVAQQLTTESLPVGTSDKTTFEMPGVGQVDVTSDKVHFADGDWDLPEEDADAGMTIRSVKLKKGTTDHIIIEAANSSGYGATYVLKFVKGVTKYHYTPDGVSHAVYSASSYSIEEADGDAIYVTTTAGLFVSRDTLKTFQIDSAGLGSAYIWNISLDTAQYVYAATDIGLFIQHPDSNVWHKVSSFTLKTNLFTVFVDRRNRILLGGNGGGTYFSSDNGATWILDSAGIGNGAVGDPCDDAFGNLYGVFSSPISGNPAVFKSAGGTQPWTEIDQGILDIAVNPLQIHDLKGDSSLYVATSFGSFRSTDQGTTWASSGNGLLAENYYGYSRNNNDQVFMSTDLGIFRKGPSDTVWTKILPTSGYQGNLPLYGGGSGALYTMFPNPNSNFSHVLGTVLKSTDAGATWLADTDGIWQTSGGIFFVDENGGQHCAATYWGGSWTSIVLKKDPGSSWVMDTVGYPVFNYSYTSSMASNKHGLLYASGSFTDGSTTYERVLHRPMGGGTWVPDTVGIPSSINYFNFLFPDKDGNMFGLIGTLLYHEESGIWVKKNFPGNSYGTYKVCVDSSGAIYLVRSQFVGNSFADVGVSVSTDNGTTWTDLTHDTTKVQILSSFGDTTYVVTSKWVTVLTSKGVLGTLSYQAADGWNMISVPYVVGDFHKTVLYPSAVSPAFAYSGGYIAQTVLQNGSGYWLNFSSTTPITVMGSPIQKETLAVATGWNMIGPPSTNVLKASITPVGTTVKSNYFGYTAGLGYTVNDTLSPGYGYWVNVSQSGQLILPGSSNIPGKNQKDAVLNGPDRLVITDAVGRQQTLYIGKGVPTNAGFYQMPPIPPDGIFDARFASHRIAEFVENDQPKEFQIALSSAIFPITVTSHLASFHASISTAGKIVPLLPNKKVPISDRQSMITLKITKGAEIPKQFALEQNFPNPFNPTTEIRYQVAEGGTVTLKIYDLLGREVATLVDEDQQPGVYSVTWDATAHASGVYYYRLSAGEFSDLKKLVLLK